MKTIIASIVIATVAFFALTTEKAPTESQVQVASIQQQVDQEAIQIEKDLEAALSAQGATAAVVYE